MTPRLRAPRRPTSALRMAVLGAGVLALACQVDLNRMLDQHKYEPYEPSSFFDDGQIMRRPPAGTVQRDATLGPPELVLGRRAGQYVDAIPLPVDAALIQRGQNRFRIFCQTCHGALGDGNSQVAENMKLRKPTSLHEPRILAYSPGRLYRVIQEGYGLMPAYDEQLGIEDRWAVVAFVQVLQLSQNAALAELPADLRREGEPWWR